MAKNSIAMGINLRNQGAGSPDHIQESAIFTMIYYLLHLHFI